MSKNIYVPKKPELGDERYAKFVDKNALDMLRVLYYDYFHKDPNISLVENAHFMFGDPTLPIDVSTFLVRGDFPFRVMFSSFYKDYKPNEDWAVGVEIKRCNLEQENSDEYLDFISGLIRKYSNNDINFICGDGQNQICTLAYIGNRDFRYQQDKKMYHYFFYLLFDNLQRNVIYIGDSMKKNVSQWEIELVHSEFIMPDIKTISQGLGIDEEEFIKQNEEIKRKILRLPR